MKDLMGMMKQAAQLQAKLQAAQAELDTLEVEAISGGGMVRVRMTAKGEVKAVSIDPSLMTPDDKDMLEDLLVTALAVARRKGEQLASEKMQSLTAGLPLPPGMKLPF